MKEIGRVARGSALPLAFLAAGALGNSCDRRAPPTASRDAVISPAPASPAAFPTAAETPRALAGVAETREANSGPFETTVAPILSARCAPCHFPGGKMYERLPFDKPATLANHRDGVRRRLKGDDLAAFEKWVATQPASSEE